MTVSALAKLLGLDRRSVTAYESGETVPMKERLTMIAKTLRFPETFFYGDDLELPNADGVSFRSMARMSAAQRASALAAGAIAEQLDTWIDERFVLPSPNVPDLSKYGEPEAAADALRQIWALGALPIKNVIHLLESKGVRVYSLSIDARELDAFSLWRGDTPFVFLNTMKSAEHSRMDAAHELGHLVLHRHGAPLGPEAEREANAFASAFLMPRSTVSAAVVGFPSLDSLIKLKKNWTVSVAALAFRLHSIGAISDWHYRSLFVQISSRGFRTQEPDEAPRERSQILAKVFAALREDSVGRTEIARQLRIHGDELEHLCFGLALTMVPSDSDIRTSSGDRPPPTLKLVN